MDPSDARATVVVDQINSALRLANRAVVSDIETYSAPVQLEGQRWYDTRPMLDPREHSPEALDMAVEALAYAEFSGLVQRHPQLRYLVQICSTTPKG